MVGPIFPGLGGLSVRRDRNIGITPSSGVVMATCKLCGRYVKLHKKGLNGFDLRSLAGKWLLTDGYLLQKINSKIQFLVYNITKLISINKG